MSKKEELINIIQQYPEHRLVSMFSNEGNGDYAYSLGEIERIEVTEMTVYNDERAIFSDEFDKLLEIIEEDVASDKHGYSKILSDEENSEVEKLAKEEILKYKWESVIVIYVGN